MRLTEGQRLLHNSWQPNPYVYQIGQKENAANLNDLLLGPSRWTLVDAADINSAEQVVGMALVLEVRQAMLRLMSWCFVSCQIY